MYLLNNICYAVMEVFTVTCATEIQTITGGKTISINRLLVQNYVSGGEVLRSIIIKINNFLLLIE